MLRTIAAASAALFITTVGAAAQAVPYWDGVALVDSVTAACANNGFIGPRELMRSAYRAKTGIAGEPSNPGLTFNQARSSHAFFRNGGTANANTMNGAGTAKGFLIRGNVTTIPSPTQTTYNATFNFKVSPATITATTQTVTIDGWINNWRNVPNCKVTFRAAYRLGPWK